MQHRRIWQEGGYIGKRSAFVRHPAGTVGDWLEFHSGSSLSNVQELRDYSRRKTCLLRPRK